MANSFCNFFNTKNRCKSGSRRQFLHDHMPPSERSYPQTRNRFGDGESRTICLRGFDAYSPLSQATPNLSREGPQSQVTVRPQFYGAPLAVCDEKTQKNLMPRLTVEDSTANTQQRNIVSTVKETSTHNKIVLKISKGKVSCNIVNSTGFIERKNLPGSGKENGPELVECGGGASRGYKRKENDSGEERSSESRSLRLTPLKIKLDRIKSPGEETAVNKAAKLSRNLSFDNKNGRTEESLQLPYNSQLNNNSIRNHSQLNNTTKLKYSCGICKEGHADRSKLYSHYSLAHFKDQILENNSEDGNCPYCKGFIKDKLKRVVHLGVAHGMVDLFLDKKHHIKKKKIGIWKKDFFEYEYEINQLENEKKKVNETDKLMELEPEEEKHNDESYKVTANEILMNTKLKLVQLTSQSIITKKLLDYKILDHVPQKKPLVVNIGEDFEEDGRKEFRLLKDMTVDQNKLKMKVLAYNSPITLATPSHQLMEHLHPPLTDASSVTSTPPKFPEPSIPLTPLQSSPPLHPPFIHEKPIPPAPSNSTTAYTTSQLFSRPPSPTPPCYTTPPTSPQHTSGPPTVTSAPTHLLPPPTSGGNPMKRSCNGFQIQVLDESISNFEDQNYPQVLNPIQTAGNVSVEKSVTENCPKEHSRTLLETSSIEFAFEENPVLYLDAERSPIQEDLILELSSDSEDSIDVYNTSAISFHKERSLQKGKRELCFQSESDSE